jgi:hypothetical protein
LGARPLIVALGHWRSLLRKAFSEVSDESFR